MKKLYSAILIANLLIESVGAFVLFAIECSRSVVRI